MKELVIVGASGLGREILAWIRHSRISEYVIAGFVDDDLSLQGEQVGGYPVLGNMAWLSDQEQYSIICATGLPEYRRKVAGLFRGRHFPSFVHPSAQILDGENVQIGEGVLIGPSSVLTTQITVGAHSFINLACTIGHDVTIDQYCSLMPSVNVSGGINLGKEVYVGTGSQLIKEVKIGGRAIIGAGSVVRSDIPGGEVWAGVPATKIERK